jgi:hypothetical protein
MEFDRWQTTFYQTPTELERRFTESTYLDENSSSIIIGNDIRDNYITSQLNALLNTIFTKCIEYTFGSDAVYINEWRDVLHVKIAMGTNTQTEKTEIVLKEIIVRPCFAGYGMLTIVVYLLLRAATKRCDTSQVIVHQCVDTTVAVLRTKFPSVMNTNRYLISHNDVDPIHDCIFTNFTAAADNAKITGLKLTNKVTPTANGALQLIDTGFPRASELNNMWFVERSARWTDDAETESQFATKVPGDIPDDYLATLEAQLNGMVTAFTQNPRFNLENNHVLHMKLSIAAKPYSDANGKLFNKFILNTDNLSERPCVAGYGLIPIVIIQLLCMTWTMKAMPTPREVVSLRVKKCKPSMARLLQVLFPSSIIDYSSGTYLSATLPDCVIRPEDYPSMAMINLNQLGIASAVTFNDSGLKLHQAAFLGAAELNRKRGTDKMLLQARIDTEIRELMLRLKNS